MLFILRSRLLFYSAGSGVNIVQVVLSGFSVEIFCFVQEKTCRYGCMYSLAAFVLVDVICVGPDLNRCYNLVIPLSYYSYHGFYATLNSKFNSHGV